MTRLVALLGAVGISFSAIFVRLADASPGTVAFFRVGYALPALLVIWLIVRRHDRRSAVLWLAALAGLFFALDLNFWNRSIDNIGAGLATVLANTQVVFVGVAAWFLHRERPTGVALVTIPIVFGGVVLISGLGRPGAYGDDPTLGVLFGVLTALAYSAFLLVFRASNRSLAPSVNPLLYATAAAALGCLAGGAVDPDFSLEPSWPSHGWLLALALVGQIAGWLLISAALPRLPALETSVLLLLQPMLAVLWAFIIFSEHLSALQWAGVAMVLGGLAVLTTRGSVRPPVTAPAEP